MAHAVQPQTPNTEKVREATAQQSAQCAVCGIIGKRPNDTTFIFTQNNKFIEFTSFDGCASAHLRCFSCGLLYRPHLPHRYASRKCFFLRFAFANVFSHNKHRLFIVVQLRVALCQNVINVNGLSTAADKAYKQINCVVNLIQYWVSFKQSRRQRRRRYQNGEREEAAQSILNGSNSFEINFVSKWKNQF